MLDRHCISTIESNKFPQKVIEPSILVMLMMFSLPAPIDLCFIFKCLRSVDFYNQVNLKNLHFVLSILLLQIMVIDLLNILYYKS